jgi:hypothetical protein
MKREGLKLKGFLSYDFKLESIFFYVSLSFYGLLLGQYKCMMSCNMSVLYVPHQKKSFAKYIWRTYNRWQIAFIP